MLTAAGGQVTLRVGAADGEGVIDVVDQGPGIQQSEQSQVFDRLYRTTAARAGQVPGIGVGLTIAKSIVEAHGNPEDPGIQRRRHRLPSCAPAEPGSRSPPGRS